MAITMTVECRNCGRTADAVCTDAFSGRYSAEGFGENILLDQLARIMCRDCERAARSARLEATERAEKIQSNMIEISVHHALLRRKREEREKG